MLKLAAIRRLLPFRIQKGMSVQSIKEFAENRFGDTLDFDVYLPSKGKNLQRPFVWNLNQKQELVLSVLKGQSIPSLALIQYKAETGGAVPCVYKVIDGKQRLSTLMEFYKGEFSITFNGEEFFFKDLEDKAQWEIANLYLHFDLAHEYDFDMISDDMKIAWFEQINFAGTPQDIDHLNFLKS